MQFKKLVAAAAIGAAFIGGSLAATPALAQHGYGGGFHGGYGGFHGGYGYGWGGWHGGYWGPGVGFYFGPGYFPGDYYGYYPPYAPGYAYGYGVAPVPQTYVEQGAQQAAPAGDYSWYRCDSANGTFYPYVKTCPGGWTKVAPSAPPQ